MLLFGKLHVVCIAVFVVATNTARRGGYVLATGGGTRNNRGKQLQRYNINHIISNHPTTTTGFISAAASVHRRRRAMSLPTDDSSLRMTKMKAKANNEKPQQSTSTNKNKKQIVFVRHSTTYMNEYLGRSLSFGAPGFSDVFPNKDLPLYQDTPLSPRGIQLVERELTSQCPDFINDDLNLVVVSPLTRALQTLDLGLRPHLESLSLLPSSPSDNNVPVMVLPEAAERLYLISDVGRPISQLEQEYGHYMDFGEIAAEDRDGWWWTPPTGKGDGEKKSSTADGGYVEWRPVGRGQRYACPGEPEADFDARMLRLYRWLEQRSESKIAVVCHHGVIEWMLDMDFDNCQWRTVDFEKIQPRALQRIKEDGSKHMSSSSYF